MERPDEDGRSEPLRVLHLEDNDMDAEILAAEFEAFGRPVEIVFAPSREKFLRELEGPPFDLIVSDHTLRSFDGARALRIVRRKCPAVPFLLFTGTIGEEQAVELIRAGAVDCVLKSNAKRLIPAVRRALKEAGTAREADALRKQLERAQKLESLGRLAGGIAHDVNNLAGAIGGFCELLLRDMEPAGDPKADDVRAIKETAARASGLASQLLAFSRRQPAAPKPVDLNVVVSGVRRLLGGLLGEGVSIRIEPAPEPVVVLADPGQVEQIVVNLAINARDAMPDGGTVTLCTRSGVDGSRLAGTLIVPAAGPCGELTVVDTGEGMSPEVLDKVCEPFFTTKPEGKGTGLGLSTVYGIVRQSGGGLGVESAPGAGTVFHVALPAA